LSAYDIIQSDRRDWLFLVDDFSFPTVNAQQAYDPSGAGIITDTDLGSWIIDSVKLYSVVTDENLLGYVSWNEFNAYYKLASFRTTTGRPSVFSIDPSKQMVFWPIPDGVYTVSGQYRKRPDTMALDADTPIFPVEFHMAVVWRALMIYAGYEEAQTVYAHAASEYNKLMAAMRRDQLPAFFWGTTLQ